MSSPVTPPWPMGRSALRKLGKKKFRQSTGLYLLEGTVSVSDALKAGFTLFGAVHDERAYKNEACSTLLKQLKKNNIKSKELAFADIKAMCGLDSPPPLIGIVKKPEIVSCSIPPKKGLTLALDRINDPGNLGTIIRSAAFFGIKEIWLGKGTTELYNPKTLRAAMSAHFHLTICPDIDLEEKLLEAKSSGAVIYASVVDKGERPEYIKDMNERSILLLGNEASGLGAEMQTIADKLVEIERTGPVDSLNVAMAGTILMDRLTRQ